MRLNVLTPTESIVEDGIMKIIAEGENGFFCLLPNHIDYVSVLTAGILSYDDKGGTFFMAIDEGILVKKGEDVFISVRNAFKGENLAGLRKIVEEKYENVELEEKKARNILAGFEGNITKLILEIK